MFKEGPLPAAIHGLAEYIGGALFIALPLVLAYDSGAATAASIVIGVLMIGVAASTDWGMSLNNQIPKPVHFAIDWVLAAVLIASPFLFGFSDESTPTAIFIAAGVLHLLLTIATRFGEKKKKPAAAAKSTSTSSKVRAAEADRQREVEAGQPAGDQPAGTGDRQGARRS
jgi:hypothetical protein